MTNTLTLTKYLYYVDEVELSLLDCMLEKRSLNEALFWISEYYNSGFITESWSLLWKIYFDFYAITNPKFFKKIHSLWKRPSSLKNVLYIVKNLFMSNSCWHVFLFRIKKYENPLTIYISKDQTSKAQKFSRKENIIISIKKRHIGNLRHHLDKIDITDTQFIIQHFTSEEKSKFEFYDYPQQLMFHFISYYMLSHMNLQQTKKKNTIGHKVTKLEIEEAKDIYTVYGYERYSVLPGKRLYQISEKIGCFEKCRDDTIILHNRLLTVHEIYWNHWLYFSHRCPIWKQRIEEFNGIVDNIALKVVFSTDEKEEGFYEKYGLEPDEQTKQCHMQSVLDIPDNTIANWLNDKFNLELRDEDVRCEIYDYKN